MSASRILKWPAFNVSGIPAWNDLRLKVFGLQALFVVLGMTMWGFNRSPEQVLFIVLACCLLDAGLHYLLRRKEILFPLSAAVTGMSLSILTNFAHGLWLALIPPFFAISSKYIFTAGGKHVYNPSMFGIVACLLFTNGMITPAPAYQWGGSGITAFFVVTAALMLFALKINRKTLIASFLIFYCLQIMVRMWLLQYHLPPETFFMGAFSSPAFYLFTFFMITDPKTSPDKPRDQVLMAFFIVFVDLLLHKYEIVASLFYAGFLYFTLRWIVLLTKERVWDTIPLFPQKTAQIIIISIIGLTAVSAHALTRAVILPHHTGFQFVEIAPERSHITGAPSDIFTRVDPKLQNVGKWLLSIGDAAAVADVNQDGLPDVFLTQPLKASQDRAQLYLNKGSFTFEVFPLPMLERYRTLPEKNGLLSGALWFDPDNDGDQDLFITAAFGAPVLLKNTFKEKGALGFEDITAQAALDKYLISVTANVLDMDQDGFLDLIIGNVMQEYLPGYEKPTRFNIFALPEAANDQDRRMVNVMHRTWYNADNGGENYLFKNRNGSVFEKLDFKDTGFKGTRWTMDIATGDLNADGWPDLYMANDFGPDALYINQVGKNFAFMAGGVSGEVGRDTYKGMNASFGDIDGNGYPDIYVSNVHERLQAEGSLLWLNQGNFKKAGYRAFRDGAAAMNILNEKRFGWGAAFGDLDRDGDLDVLQANGMMDDAYDDQYEGCPDYWYWNAQIALTGPDVHGYADRWADVRGRCIFPHEQNRVYLNQGHYFVDVANNVGWTKKGTSRGIALADFDNDGDLDVFVTHMTAPPSLYRNDSEDSYWLGLDLRGNGKTCNRDAIGTKIRIERFSGGRKQVQYREVYASNGLSAQNDHRLVIGLAQTKPESVNVFIQWCGQGAEEERRDLVLNRYHDIGQRR